MSSATMIHAGHACSSVCRNLAVAGDVDADIALAADALGDRVAEGLLECAFVDRFTGFVGTMRGNQRVRAWVGFRRGWLLCGRCWLAWVCPPFAPVRCLAPA